MMNMLIAAKPLFNSGMIVEGYYFTYQFGNAILEAAKSNPLDGAMNSPFLDFVNRVKLEALTQNKMIFIPVTQILLMTELDKACEAEPEKVALLLEKNVKLDEVILERVKHFVALGFKIALYEQNNQIEIRPFLPYLNFIFVEMPVKQLRDILRNMRDKYEHVSLVVTDVSSKMSFDEIKNIGENLFDGLFYKIHIPTLTRQNALSPLKVNYIQLLNVVNQDDFDFQAFTRIVRQDTALAIQFMRLVNSSSHANSSIKNINQAAAMLGQKEIKKWISTAVSSALCADHPSEITRLSLLRAKFCENMAKHFEMGVLHDNLFLTGLFSVLDVILEMPIEEALNMVFVPEIIRVALAEGRGEFSNVLDFVLRYEQGDWQEISRIALMQDISISAIHDAYVDAMIWFGDLLNTPAQEEEPIA